MVPQPDEQEPIEPNNLPDFEEFFLPYLTPSCSLR
ncbi:MAG: hypothetical protein QOI57_3293 [Rubrobacteraceae bacterium]|nr:hypothetical protein [Rubrobacteraceae bacterium]